MSTRKIAELEAKLKLAQGRFNDIFKHACRAEEYYANVIKTNHQEIDSLKMALRHSQLNFTHRKVVFGGKGSGKTEFIKRHIIPQLGNNYFVIDYNNEYDKVLKANKVVIDKSQTPIAQLLQIKKAISANFLKVIIFEDYDILSQNYKINIFDHINIPHLNFIIVIQDARFLVDGDLKGLFGDKKALDTIYIIDRKPQRSYIFVPTKNKHKGCIVPEAEITNLINTNHLNA